MRAITTIGLDIAKSVFQVHGIDAQRGRPPAARANRLEPIAHYKIWPAFANQAVLTAARPARKLAIMLWLPSNLFGMRKLPVMGRRRPRPADGGGGFRRARGTAAARSSLAGRGHFCVRRPIAASSGGSGIYRASVLHFPPSDRPLPSAPRAVRRHVFAAGSADRATAFLERARPTDTAERAHDRLGAPISARYCDIAARTCALPLVAARSARRRRDLCQCSVRQASTHRGALQFRGDRRG